MKKVVLYLLVSAGIIWLLTLPSPLPANVGNGDFTAYWSAAYLLAHQENFADPDLLLKTEQELAGWTGDFTLQTWNPPWFLPLMLPYTLFPFTTAVWLWFLTNIALVFTAAILTWKACTTRPTADKTTLIAPLIAILFLPTLNAIYMGQVNTLVFFGLALMLFCQQKEHQTLAGAALVLTLVKPHLVYVTIPILLLQALSSRQWRFLVGFGSALALLTGITFLFRPSFITEYASTTAEGNLLSWATPTLGGILSTTLGWQEARLMGLIVLPLTICWWWLNRGKFSIPILVQSTLLISVMTAPFGWGYDAIVLLIPILQIAVWLVEGRYSTQSAWLFIAALVLIAALAFYQRRVMQSEVEVFWIPLAITAVYFTAYYLQKKELAVAQTA
jgi:hypothetical protein